MIYRKPSLCEKLWLQVEALQTYIYALTMLYLTSCQVVNYITKEHIY